LGRQLFKNLGTVHPPDSTTTLTAFVTERAAHSYGVEVLVRIFELIGLPELRILGAQRFFVISLFADELLENTFQYGFSTVVPHLGVHLLRTFFVSDRLLEQEEQSFLLLSEWPTNVPSLPIDPPDSATADP
jgi:hypothetical protein